MGVVLWCTPERVSMPPKVSKPLFRAVASTMLAEGQNFGALGRGHGARRSRWGPAQIARGHTCVQQFAPFRTNNFHIALAVDTSTHEGTLGPKTKTWLWEAETS